MRRLPGQYSFFDVSLVGSSEVKRLLNQFQFWKFLCLGWGRLSGQYIIFGLSLVGTAVSREKTAYAQSIVITQIV